MPNWALSERPVWSESCLAAIVRDDSDLRLPVEARMALEELVEQIETVTARIERLDRKILEAVRKDDSARRLTAIPGVGPIIAAKTSGAPSQKSCRPSKNSLDE
ncbi:hypothetical protein [Agrobacterium leguminum]|uniref:hypothetical protein n=1 Tax=Agrobacterium leguminum TaxID=2792015 RepID=UPI001F400D27|nr:hypothetical protein [Agrobacterium leguminum]